jgi:hypothetical protein
MPESAPDDVVEQSTPTEVVDISTQTDESPAESSTADTKPAVTMLDTVKAALKPKEESPTSEKPDATADAADPVAKDTASDPFELTAEEKQRFSAKSQARFTKLATDSKAKDATIASLQPRADEYDKIDKFISQAGLTRQDVGSTLQIAAMLVNDPHGARERLRPIMAELDRVLGETLPPELQQRVDQGYLTEEDARRLNRAEANVNLSQRRTTALTEQQQQADAVREQKQLTDSTLSSITTWEANKAKSDPDWHLKRDDVAEQVELAIQRKSLELKRAWFPNSEEAVKLSEDALKKVSERAKRFGPKPKAVIPATNTGVSTRTTQAPKTMLEVVRANMAGGA